MHRFARLFPLLAATALLLPAKESAPPLRLDPSVKPTHYAVELTIDPSQTTFQGRVQIDLQISQPARHIVTHGISLNVHHAALRTASGEAPVTVQAEKPDRLIFTPSTPVNGAASLLLDYDGPVSGTEMSGIFRQQIGADWYVFTQFEAIDARRAFPCFDEPGFKTPWDVKLRVPQGLVAAANSPVAQETPETDNRKLIAFAPTRPLPSYLVAFVVGPFDVIDAGTSGRNATPLRLLVPRGRAAEARYAADSMASIFQLVENYFGSAFPYPKLDSVVIPKFPGAMENAGLITYQESLLLAKPSEESPARQREFAVTAAHEIAHHWVGDLVTMAWWDDLWLNEGFASWMEDKVIGQWKPDWRQDFVRVHNRAGAMSSDSLTTARRIRQPIRTSDDIVNAFDAITYLKGAAVLSMFESYLGPDKFRAGVQNYLNSHRDRTATADDFLNALSKAAGRDIAPAFRTFLDQSGVPDLTISLDCTKSPTLRIHQQRYKRLGDTTKTAQQWKVPFCYRTEQGSACTLVQNVDTVAPLAACPAYLIPDAGAQGYYRYTFAAGTNAGERTLAEQVSDLENIDAAVRSGMRPASDLFPLLRSLASVQDQYVFSTAIDLAANLRRVVPETARPAYAAFIRDTFGDRARELGWQAKEGESEDTRLVRPSLLSLVAEQGEDPELVRQAIDLTHQWLIDHRALPGDTVDLALRVAAYQGGNEALRQELVQAWRQAKEQREKDRLLGALGSFPASMLPEILSWTLNKEVTGPEVATVLARSSRHRNTSDAAFRFVQTHFQELLRKMPRDDEPVLVSLTSGFCTASQAMEVRHFFERRTAEIPGGPRVLDETVESIGQCSALQTRQGPSVATALVGGARGGATHTLGHVGTKTTQQ